MSATADLLTVRFAGIFHAAHQTHHNAVASATNTQTVLVDPIRWDDPRSVQVFLLSHYLAHQSINRVLGTTGPDLSVLDINDPEDVAGWVELNFIDHQGWGQQLGV